MAINVKEILEKVDSYTRGNDGKINATAEFKKLCNDNLIKINEVLKNDNETSEELIKSLDNLVYAILDYRYNIVDYGHYSDDTEDNGRCHLYVRK